MRSEDTVDLSVLKDKTKLEYLSVCNNSIEKDSIRYLPKSITDLDLSNCGITPDYIELISLPNLQGLSLKSNPIDSMSDEALRAISSVRYLILNETEFEDNIIVYRLLESIPNLEMLDFDRTPMCSIL